MDRGAWLAIVHGVTVSNMTELTLAFHYFRTVTHCQDKALLS